jgi:hypothetical protein
VRSALVIVVLAALVVWQYHLWPHHTPQPPHEPVPIEPMPMPMPPPPIDAAEPLGPVARLPIPTKTIDVPDTMTIKSFVGGIVAVDGRLVWTDNFGSIWTMPATGGAARELASQADAVGNPQYQALVVHRGVVYASRTGAMATVALPNGPVALAWADPDDDEYALVSDGTAIYGAKFDARAVVRFGGDGSQTKLAALHSGVLATAGSGVYVADFGASALVEVAPAHRVIAHVSHPTGIAVDDRAAYVWSQGDGTLRRIELASGRVTWRIALAEGDPLLADGDWIYGHAIDNGAPSLVRVAKDGSELDVVAPVDGFGRLAADADAIYDSGPGYILRVDKARVQPSRVTKPATVAR